MEDIIAVVDGRPGLVDEVTKTEANVREYIMGLFCEVSE